MKKLIFFIVLIPSLFFAQVGIGTTSPNSSLDIRSSNQATPANTDGVLVPKVDTFPATSPGANQTSMLVYLTTNITFASINYFEGFHYWDNALTRWIPLTSIERINDLLDGKSDVDGSEDGSSVFLGIDAGAGDDSSDNKNVGVGFQVLEDATTAENNVGIGYRALRENTGVGNTAIGHVSLRSNDTGANNTAVGRQTLSDNTTGSSNVAIGAFSLSNNETGINNVATGNQSLRSNIDGTNNVAIGDYAGRTLDLENTALESNDQNVYIGGGAGNSDHNASGNVYIGYNSGAGDVVLTTGTGYTGTLENKSGNVFIGHQSGYNESNSDRLYIENTNAGQNGALIYGRFDTDIVRVNGTLQIANPGATSGYAFPTADGAANQVLTTDGAGVVTWEDSNNAMPLARATLSAAQTITAANTWTKVNFDTVDFEVFNTSSDFNTGTNVYTVPADGDGIYRITAMYTNTATVNNNNTFGIRITRNISGGGTSNLQEVNYKHMSENSNIVRQISTLAQLGAGDSIEIQARANVASILIIDTPSRFTSFTIERVR